jgi:hypothetical protein
MRIISVLAIVCVPAGDEEGALRGEQPDNLGVAQL